MKDELININFKGARLLDPLNSIDKIANLYIRTGKIYFDRPKKESKIPVKEVSLEDHVIIPEVFDIRVHSRVL